MKHEFFATISPADAAPRIRDGHGMPTTRASMLDYRLAPEYAFPAALDDAIEAYRALLDGGARPSAIAFAGDSAGGGLTVTTCLAARTAGLPMPAALVAFSPGLDMTRTGESMDTKAGLDPFFTRESLGYTTD